MPSFVCDACQETLKKPKLDLHAQRCRQASFSCIDCYKSFKGVDYRQHFTCITEVEKYEKKKPLGEKPAVDLKKQTVDLKVENKRTSDLKIEEIESEQSIVEATLELVKSGSLPLSSVKKALKKSPYSFPKKSIKKHFEKSLFLSLSKKGELNITFVPQ